MAGILWERICTTGVPEQFSVIEKNARDNLDSAWAKMRPGELLSVETVLQECDARCSVQELLRTLATHHYDIYIAAVGVRGLVILISADAKKTASKCGERPSSENKHAGRCTGWVGAPFEYERCDSSWYENVATSWLKNPVSGD
jgi:hypothetical protein|tara:strand:+ start:225 stop:656 length:432 start_codon:yes stop_codon:yes gene_type:complete